MKFPVPDSILTDQSKITIEGNRLAIKDTGGIQETANPERLYHSRFQRIDTVSEQLRKRLVEVFIQFPCFSHSHGNRVRSSCICSQG